MTPKEKLIQVIKKSLRSVPPKDYSLFFAEFAKVLNYAEGLGGALSIPLLTLVVVALEVREALGPKGCQEALKEGFK